MSNFCLPKFAADAFKTKLKDGSIQPEKLSEMTSEERRSFFTEIIGEENAKSVNALFESKLLLKNQQQGMVNWAEKVSGLKKEVKRDLLSRIQKMDRILSPKELNMFYEDLAAQRVGIEVTVEEAGKIVHLSNEVKQYKAKAAEDGTFPSEQDRLNYGLSLVNMKNYISELKTSAEKYSVSEFKRNPLSGITQIGSITKSILASLDNSFIGRQGIKALYNNPGLWGREWLASWGRFGKQLVAKNEGSGVFANQNDAVINALKADIYSRPNAVNGLYEKANLAVGLRTEEAFPSSLPGRIPVLGRLFHASETAYNSAALRMRADWFDKYVKLAEKSGVNLADKAELQSLGKLVNSLTGRGALSTNGKTLDAVNATFFSPRFMKSNWDILTAHAGDNMTKFARKQAAINTVRTVGGIAATMFIADKLGFGIDLKKKLGRINIAGTWVDVSGGNYAFAQLGSNIYERLKNQKGKYGEQTGLDVVEGFFEGKLSPLFGAIRDNLKGRDYQGNKPTLGSTAGNLGVPLPIQTYEQISNSPKGADGVARLILEALELQGFSTNTPNK